MSVTRESVREMARRVLSSKARDNRADRIRRERELRQTITLDDVAELRLCAGTLMRSFSYRDPATGIWQQAAADVAVNTVNAMSLLLDRIDSVEVE